MTSWPDESLGALTADLSVTGPLQLMSKLQVAGTDTGVSNRNKALGMSKKSTTARSVAVICAFPAPKFTVTPSGARSGEVQKSPPGYGSIPGSKSWT
jgi:hypothetical protein